MVTKYAKKNIFGVSDKITKINDNDFDIFFYTVGWESRFAEILNHLGDSFQSGNNYVLSFKTKNEDGNYVNGYDINKKSEFIKELKVHIGAEPKSIEFEYSEFKEFANLINDIISSELEVKQRPLKVGFEISTCPRYYFLYVLGLCIHNNYTSNLSFFYSEGEYSDNVESNDFDDFFNSYGVETVIIPYSGSTIREGEVVLIFSLGFESHFIIDEINKYDPDYVIFLCAIPGYNLQYEDKVKYEIKRVVSFCELTENMYTQNDAAAGDAISAWEQLEGNAIALEDSNIIDFRDSYIVHYATGTKPHCLAMFLNGLVNDNVVVKYRVVKKYKRREVKPNGIFWRYDITNLRVI